MDGKSRIFRPEAEKVWHEDYQCEYYRGVIIDGEDNIVERCAKMHPNYTAAFSDAEEKMSVSPLYSRQTSPDMKKKLEEYKAKKALEKSKRQTMRQSLKSTPPIIGDVASCIRPEDYLTMA